MKAETTARMCISPDIHGTESDPHVFVVAPVSVLRKHNEMVVAGWNVADRTMKITQKYARTCRSCAKSQTCAQVHLEYLLFKLMVLAGILCER